MSATSHRINHNYLMTMEREASRILFGSTVTYRSKSKDVTNVLPSKNVVQKGTRSSASPSAKLQPRSLSIANGICIFRSEVVRRWFFSASVSPKCYHPLFFHFWRAFLSHLVFQCTVLATPLPFVCVETFTPDSG